MQNIHIIDERLIRFFRKITIPSARISIFIVFFWFGLLKVLHLSPAGPLVQKLFEETIPFIPFSIFYTFFGILECVIGVMFIIKGLERIVIPFLFLHMITTFMPLFLLPEETWSGFLVPTLTGQYIIKNLVVIAAAIAIASHIHPLPYKSEADITIPPR